MVKIDTNLHIYHKFDSNRVTGADYIHWNIWLQKLRFVFYSLPAVDEHSDSVSILAFTLTMSRYRQKVLPVVFSSEKAHQEQKKFYQTYFGHILWDERRNWGIQFLLEIVFLMPSFHITASDLAFFPLWQLTLLSATSNCSWLTPVVKGGR